MSERLSVQEWLVVALMSAIMLALGVVAWMGEVVEPPLTGTPYSLLKDIEVTIKGAVAHPGKYRLSQGSQLEQLLEKASPLPQAHLKRLKLKSRLREGQIIQVPFSPSITVFLEGAILSPGPLIIYQKQTRLQDLESLLEFLPGADRSILHQKRRVKDQEIIYIPFKAKRDT